MARLFLATSLLLMVAMTAGCATPTPPSASVRGVLLDVEAPSLMQVNSFSVRDDDGKVWDFRAAPDFNAGATHVMTPGHMRQHMALGDPVTVTYRSDGTTFIALAATD